MKFITSLSAFLLFVSFVQCDLNEYQNNTISTTLYPFLSNVTNDIPDLNDILPELDSLENQTTNDDNNTPANQGLFTRFRKILESFIPLRILNLWHSFDKKFDVRERYTNFKQFMKQYNKNYNVKDIPRRFKAYMEHLQTIEQSNKDYAEGKTTFIQGINKFVDWDDKELSMMHSLHMPSDEESDSQEQPNIGTSNIGNSYTSWLWPFPTISDDNSLPKNKSWTHCERAITDQGLCGACYAFATLGVIETMHCLRGTKTSLSVQELVDCSHSHGNSGCNGGWPTRVFRYLNDQRGVTDDKCYPYEMKRNSCRKSKQSQKCNVPNSVANGKATIKYSNLKGEYAMRQHVAKEGPLVAVLHANNNFLFYKRGIYSDYTCPSYESSVNHGVIISGYGEENGKKYWLIRNSWGRQWGDNGYAKIRRGTQECAIEHQAFAVHNI